MIAMPLRSEPELAAVAPVLGTLSVAVSEMWIQVAGIPKALLVTYTTRSLHYKLLLYTKLRLATDVCNVRCSKIYA